MDFIKKNWGLLLYSLGCLVLALVVGLRIKGAASLAAGKRKALDEQLGWFQAIKKDNIKLTKENERIAQDNRDRAERKFAELRLTMATKYHIEPGHPATPVEAVRALQDEIRTMTRSLETAQPVIDFTKCPALSFQARALSNELPSMEDVPKIFRQLRIVQEVVRVVLQSRIMRLDAIDRPMDLAVIAEDLYTATPVRLTVTGNVDQIQGFINKMTTEANFLFFLRTMSIETPDQAPNGAIGGLPSSGAGGPAGMGPGMGMEGAMAEGMGMMPPGMGPMPMGPAGAPAATPGRTATRLRRPSASATATMPPGGMAPAARMPGPEGNATTGGRPGALAEEPMWREDLTAFPPQALLTADLRFDVIEFNQPEANQ